MSLPSRWWLFGFVLLGCGSRSGLPGAGESEGTTTTTQTTAPPECELHLDPRPLGETAPGALCTAGAGALSGPTMMSVRRGALYGLTTAGASEEHQFFDGGSADVYELAHAVAVRGDWVFGADVQSVSGQVGAWMTIGHRTGSTKFESSLAAPSMDGFTSLQVTGNDAGLMVYTFVSYPEKHTLEAISSAGDLFVSAEGLDPITDPDDLGEVAVREADTPEVRTYWLSFCSGEKTETAESGRDVRTPYVAWGRFLVYTDPKDNSLVVEGSDGVTRHDLGEPAGDSPPFLFDFHPSGWALVTTPDTLRFVAIHAGTGEKRAIDIVFPPGYSRYDNYTAAFGSDQFDSNARELRVTSSGGVILPMRSASLGYLFSSQDGADWQPLGAPIGQVYTAKGVEAGGSYLHVGNAYAVTLPPWDPAPAGSGRIDYQSTQLVRPADGQSLVVEQSPMGAAYNHVYRLSADGGCLATSPVSGNGVVWTNAVTGESYSFPPVGGELDSLLPSVDWATDGDVDAASLL